MTIAATIPMIAAGLKPSDGEPPQADGACGTDVDVDADVCLPFNTALKTWGVMGDISSSKKIKVCDAKRI